MKFSCQDEAKNAFLKMDNECFSLIGTHPSAPYVCYYDDITSNRLPVALTQEGIQVPLSDDPKDVKLLTYEELVELVKDK